MGKSWRIATIAGIPVRLHWTMGLFALFVGWFAYHGSGDFQVGYFIAFIACLFVCVVLHEFGHSLTAKRYGINTKDIILSPVAGLARLENIPDNPRQEFKIAINGPLVNLVIAGILSVIILVAGLSFDPGFQDGVKIYKENFIQCLMYMNIFAFIFNLIPAIPMDGGRILRSFLSTRIGRTRATYWSSIIGKMFAVGFVLVAVIKGIIMLAIIGAIIYFLAGEEYQQAKLNELMKETSLLQIMNKAFTKVHQTDSIEGFLRKLQETEERDFVVYDKEGNICGSLPSLFVEDIKKHQDRYEQIKDIASSKHNSLEEGQSIEEAFVLMKEEGLGIIAIKKDGHTTGVVDRPIISKFILANSRKSFFS